MADKDFRVKNGLIVGENAVVNGEVLADSVQLSGGTADQGTLTWDTNEDTLALNEGVNSHRIGQEVLYNVKNQTGSSITQGTPVMAAGTLGNSGRILITPMDATDPANAKFYLGVATETIANGEDGKVTHFGKIRGIDLSAYSEGDVLWLSTATVGAFTATEPTIGTKIPTAFVISNHHNNGTMMVRATNSIGLVDLDDVFKETLDAGKDGQVLTWNNTNSRFEVSAITESQISDLGTYLTTETNDLTTSVTWANVPDANITESSVTQHEAALSITESQISDFGTYLTDAPSDGNQYARQNGAWSIVDAGGGSFLPTKLDPITVVNGQDTYNLTSLSQAYTPSSINALLVSLNGITQSPGDAFTISGSTITFIPALQTGDVIDFIIDLGAAVETVSTTETDTLNSVTTRGAATTNEVTVGGITSTGKYIETVFDIVGTNVTLNPANGTIQTWTLSGNSTTTDGLSSGEFITLHIDNTAAATITWPTISWTNGNSPELSTANINVVHIWKVGTSLYGSFVGEVV